MTRLLITGFLTLALVGCASQPASYTAHPDFAPVQPQAMVADRQRQAQTGSIYQQGHGMHLFQDLRAYRVGDILTVRLVESTQASKQQDTETSRDNSVGISNPTIAGRPLSDDGNPVGEFSLSSANSFSGEGASTQSNQLSGSITVMVSDVLPNGLLQVRGEKWLALNQGEEFVRVRGLVRPVDIENGNQIASTRLANAQIAYGSKGALNDANRQGWLGRFFSSIVFPF
jgi:flagellar L-ring protein precursor FlgH